MHKDNTINIKYTFKNMGIVLTAAGKKKVAWTKFLHFGFFWLLSSTPPDRQTPISPQKGFGFCSYSPHRLSQVFGVFVLSQHKGPWHSYSALSRFFYTSVFLQNLCVAAVFDKFRKSSKKICFEENIFCHRNKAQVTFTSG